MLGDDTSFFAKKLADSLLRQPNRLVFKKDFNIHLSIGSGVEEEIWLFIREIFTIHARSPPYSFSEGLDVSVALLFKESAGKLFYYRLGDFSHAHFL